MKTFVIRMRSVTISDLTISADNLNEAMDFARRGVEAEYRMDSKGITETTDWRENYVRSSFKRMKDLEP